MNFGEVYMKKELSTSFDTRQHMQSEDFEIFYYKDLNLSQVSLHIHSHYEFYYFVEGSVSYRLGDNEYLLEPGDCLLIPPGLPHTLSNAAPNSPYRRFVLWCSENFFQSLCRADAEGCGYGFRYAAEIGGLHFRPDLVNAQEIMGLLMNILEERNDTRPFRLFNLRLLIASFFVYINRLIYNSLNQESQSYENALYINICYYINHHLDEDLSLNRLADFFFVSKYHIAHIFKDSMGISIHQYILKKRLHACKNAILSGMAFTKIYTQYGFNDYTVFYRAFKKEFGMSPTAFKEQCSLTEATPEILI